MYSSNNSQDFIILAHPDGSSFEEIQDVVRIVNGLQNYFHCKLVPDSQALKTGANKLDADKLDQAIEQCYRKSRVIALTEGYFSSDLVVEERLPMRVLISCTDWDDGSRPPLGLFLIYSIASALITLQAGLTVEKNNTMGHKPPVGCIFDWWEDSKILNLDLVCARLCGPCRHELARFIDSDSQNAFNALQKILDFVRRGTMGETTKVPSKVWIVHGKGDDWKELKKILKALRVKEVDEFDETVVVGALVSDRWKQMLTSARFAFALITEDDEHIDGTKHPRLNVAHEIGLCHARLGFECTAVLRQGRAVAFTNLSGIKCLEYEAGQLSTKREEIKAILKKAGVI